MNTKQRFLAKVHKTKEGCWLWTASCYPNGYGMFSMNWRQSPNCAHRAAWQLFRGEIPDGLLVCHRCDNPKCVNPDHLFLGTQSDNMKDMSEKGRGKPPTFRGEKHLMSTLTVEDVSQIRTLLANGVSQAKVSRLFNVSQHAIWSIKTGRTWREAA